MNDRLTPREGGAATARRPSADDGRTPVRAAVFLGAAAGFRVEELLLDEPGPGEVRVRMLASGVCHSDLHVLDGDWDRPAPVVMGHEGAGIVEALGPGVGAGPSDAHPGVSAGLGQPAVGDLVVLAWTAPCGACPADVRLRRPDGTPVGVYSGIGTMATHQVVAAEAAIPVDPALPAAEAALLGCAVTTGVGAVLQTAGVRAGETVVVFGLGGVGLSAVMGAVLAGAARAVAVDRVAAKLELARALGATDVVLAGDGPATHAALVRLLPEGADHAIEAIGLAATAELAMEIVRPGGTVTLVGMTPQGVRARVDVYDFVARGVRLLGSNYGSATPATAFPELARHAVAGRLPVGRLIEERIGLDGLARAFDALRRGEGARRVVVFDPSA
jgi:S-(hydroxymethyl)glutathione dehydrogenase/alcohol dehydrogenase